MRHQWSNKIEVLTRELEQELTSLEGQITALNRTLSVKSTQYELPDEITITTLNVKNINLDSNGYIKSRDYTEGLNGTGTMLAPDPVTNKWVFHTDNIYITGTMKVKEFSAQTTSAINGDQFISVSGKIKSTNSI
jgi:hypothetical protein